MTEREATTVRRGVVGLKAGLGTGIDVVFYAVVDMLAGAVVHFGVWVGLGGALAIELEPCEAAVDVLDVAVVLIGVEGQEFVEVVERRVEGDGGIVAEGGGVVVSGPGGSVDARPGDDDRRGGGTGGDEVSLFAAVANHVEDEEAEDDGEEDVVAGAKVHSCSFSVVSSQSFVPIVSGG